MKKNNTSDIHVLVCRSFHILVNTMSTQSVITDHVCNLLAGMILEISNLMYIQRQDT